MIIIKPWTPIPEKNSFCSAFLEWNLISIRALGGRDRYCSVLTTSGDTYIFDPTSTNFNLKNGCRRHVHSAGEVTSVSTEQYLSLPPNARIEIKFHSKKAEQNEFFSGIGVQGFITINKI